MYYVREDSRTCCKNDSEHIKILDQSLGVLSTQILLIPRHAKQFWVSDEDKLALCRKLILHLDFRPKHMLKQLPTIVKRSKDHSVKVKNTVESMSYPAIYHQWCCPKGIWSLIYLKKKPMPNVCMNSATLDLPPENQQNRYNAGIITLILFDYKQRSKLTTPWQNWNSWLNCWGLFTNFVMCFSLFFEHPPTYLITPTYLPMVMFWQAIY